MLLSNRVIAEIRSSAKVSVGNPAAYRTRACGSRA
jgi:hypothetical protein